MAKGRTVFLGVGCAALVALAAMVTIVVIMFRGASLPDRMVLALNFGAPLQERTADDPFAELMGEQNLSFRDLRLALVRAAEDDRVSGVRVRLDGYGGGLAHLQELRGLLQRVQASGKWTAAYMDTAGEFSSGNGVYWLASVCDEISINPLGDVNLIGFSVRSPFIRGTFDKLGIEPEFPGRGLYKTARFMYTHSGFTPAQEEMLTWLLEDVSDQMVSDIHSSRGLEKEHVWELVNEGPHFGSEALNADLVDHLEDWGAFTQRLKEKDPAADNPVGVTSYLHKTASMESGPKIAVVTGVGAIMRGVNRKNLNPLFGGDVMGSETIAAAWRAVRKASGIKAAIFRVDSPGGSAVASEVIRAEMARTAEQIPVVVSQSNTAASGGYWVSCGAQKIVAMPATLTGSIGVFAGHLNTTDFWNEKLGVTYGRLDFADNADFYGDLDNWTDEQRAVADRLLDRIYADFLQRVADARNSDPETIHKVAEGRVFTGRQGAEINLVDVVGGFDAALLEAKRLAGIADDAKVRLVDYPEVKPLWQQILEKDRDREVALQQAYAELVRLWQSGEIETPGAVWMPPLYVN